MSAIDPTAPSTPTPSSPSPSPAASEKKATRFDAYGEPLDEQDYYCPGCGLRYEYRQRCTGIPERPHPPIEVVSTSELQGDEHTPAPSTE